MRKINIEKLNAAVKKHAAEHIENEHLLGTLCRVFQNGEMVYESCEGLANKESGKPLGFDNMYRLASMTKPVTAVATLIAEQEGLLSIYDSVSKYIPEYKELYVAKRDEDKKFVRGDKADLKIYQCLNHTCGIFGGFAEEIDGVIYPSPADEQLALMTNELRPDRTTAVLNYPKFLLGYLPGTCASYSSHAGCDICAEIISRVSGMDFDEYVKIKIFEPLSMTDTTFTPTPEQKDRLVDLTNRGANGIFTCKMGDHIFADFPPTYHTAGAGLVSTINDYSKFALMLLNWGEYEGKRILSVDSIYKMKTAYVPKFTKGIAPTSSWGLGVRVTRDDPILPDGCYGWSGAYGTHFWIDYENKIIGIYMKNSCYDGGGEAFTSREFERDVMNSLE
ncbi:MAG: serine hydrolase [Clostridia bacterium]|nr:serine hydrolase [Clostridia bacterium]